MAIPNALAAGLAPLNLAAVLPTGKGSPLGVVVEPQHGDHWCWAAVSAGIIAFVRQQQQMEQCQLVHDVLGHTHDCCDTTPPRDECDVDNELEDGLAAGDVTAVLLHQTLLFEAVRHQIEDLGKPVAALIDFGIGFDRHFVEIDGVVDDNPQHFIVNDSLFGGPSVIPVTNFTLNYRDKGGQWTWSYLIS